MRHARHADRRQIDFLILALVIGSLSIFAFVVIVIIVVIAIENLRDDDAQHGGTGATVKTLQAQTVNSRLIDCTHFTVGDAVNCTGHTDDG